MRKITPSVILQLTLILLVGFNFVAQAQGSDYRTFVPVGAVELFAGSPPDPSTGWLIADGTCISRATYATLFAVVGETFGMCDGEFNFALPDMRGRVPVGAGAGVDLTARSLGELFGEETHRLTIGQMPGHSHQQTGAGNIGLYTTGGAGSSPRHANTVTSNSTTPNMTLNTGGDDCPGGGGACVASAFEISQPSLVLNYLVWAGTVELDIAADIDITVVVVFPSHTPTPTATSTLTPTTGPSPTPTATASPTGQSIYDRGVTVNGQDVLIRNEVTPGDAAIVGVLVVIAGFIWVGIIRLNRRKR
jgi:microcystin-dependent protein